MRSKDAIGIDHLSTAMTSVAMTRRQMLVRALALGLSVPAVSGLLAACGDDEDADDDTPATEGSDDSAASDDSGAEEEPDDTSDTDSEDEDEDEPDEDDEPAAPGEREIITVRANTDFETADPAHISTPPGNVVAGLVYNGLVRYNTGDMEVVPDVASDWEISEDGVTYTFSMKEGYSFHKGYGDLTADDVVFTFQRNSDESLGSPLSLTLSSMESVEAIDDYTVEFTLSEPFSAFLSSAVAYRAGFLLNEQALTEKGDDYPQDPIGTGPYVWESRQVGTSVTMVRNEDYPEDLFFDEVRMLFIQEDPVAELALQSGDVDVCYIFQPEAAQRMLDDASGDFETKIVTSFRTNWAQFNLERPAVQDINVRKAIIHALDKQSAAQAVGGDLAQAVSSIMNPNVEGYIDPDPFPYDPDLARELLAEAGYADGLDIDVLIIPSNTWPELSVIVQAMWAEVGINANLMMPEREVFNEMIGSGEGFDIATTNITRTESSQYAERFLSTAIPDPNYSHYASDRADELIMAARSEVDADERAQLYEEFQELILVEDVVGFGMTNVGYILAWRTDIQGVDTMYQDVFYVPQMSRS